MSLLPLPDLKILIAAATASASHALSQELMAVGYRVQTMVDPLDVLIEAQTFQPDLILMHSTLGTVDCPIDGYQVCQQIKAAPRLRDVPVILIGSIDQLDRAKVFAVGGADYLIEPFEPAEILARLRAQLMLRHLHQRLLPQQVRRLLNFAGSTPLLAHLQRRLHHQTQLLQTKNTQLMQEVCDRQQAELALREEQQKSERLLLNILPQAIVDQLKQKEMSLAERWDDVTILFADIVDFTPLSAHLPPLELVSLLNQVFSAFDRLAEQYGLEKIKTIGDAYMVASGVPVPRPDHAEVMMEMAIAMRAAIKPFKRDTGRSLQLRIGMNTGTVVAGVIGIRKFSYDLWGDTVNVASRMESQGLPGKIQVTEATYQRLKHHYFFEQWGHVNIKGKGRMTTYLFVDRKSSSP